MNADAFDIGIAVKNILTGNASVLAKIDKRIYAIAAPENTPLPYVVYSRRSLEPDYSKDGDTGEYTASVQLDCYAKTYEESVDLAKLVFLSLQGKRGVFKGKNVSESHLQNASEEYASNNSYVQILNYGFKIDN
ncbi:DUF3168 domain-containing protein [Parabacteroides sp. Marseille-P3160]|uniref:tail completion protein gp17 n=1 Tax=Parabacteroides sp. Marseille-P3160 TaxID=1917887 RepID=UPI0009BA31D9|nr:DUF3168 domain-containing protein [Parabacteroides sp. Marseille-P3160]